jgi:outer membrane immunogenic protein
MFRSLGAAVATIALGSTAIAADLPSIKSAPVAAPAPMWTGFYAGLNAGGTWATNNNVYVNQTPTWFNPKLLNNTYVSTTSVVTAAGSSVAIPMQNNANFVGGIQFGYNEHINKNFVIGTEADIQGVISSSSIASSTTLADF